MAKFDDLLNNRTVKPRPKYKKPDLPADELAEERRLENADYKHRRGDKHDLTPTSAVAIQKYLAHALDLATLPKININDPVAVGERTHFYFQLCLTNASKPSASGYAQALGISSKYLYRIANDEALFESPSADIIKTGYQVLEQMWEDYMLNQKINPVAGIFIAKNQFGYQDSREVHMTQEKKVILDDPDAIRRKYMEENIVEADFVEDN